MRRIVYYYTHLSRPFAKMAAVLSEDPGAWLPEASEPADGGWLVTLRADGAVPQALASHKARFLAGAPTGDDSTLRRRVTWSSAMTERLVPTLEGDLELASLDGGACQLSLMGSYRPPLSVVGEAGDRLLGHRIAEACVRRFVLEVAERLEGVTLQA